MDYLLKDSIIEKDATSVNGFAEKIMTDKNKSMGKKILKIIGIVFAAVLAIDIISMLVYFCFVGTPH